MGNIEHSRIAVADPARFGGDPRARWMRPDDGLREDWGEVEYVRAADCRRAVEAAAAVIENTRPDDGPHAIVDVMTAEIDRLRGR